MYAHPEPYSTNADLVWRAASFQKAMNFYSNGAPSVQISNSNTDNMMTLYCLRHASGHPADYT
jgi:hypothetical protein